MVSERLRQKSIPSWEKSFFIIYRYLQVQKYFSKFMKFFPESSKYRILILLQWKCFHVWPSYYVLEILDFLQTFFFLFFTKNHIIFYFGCHFLGIRSWKNLIMHYRISLGGRFGHFVICHPWQNVLFIFFSQNFYYLLVIFFFFSN